jgi:hypothetical protein
MGGIYAIVAWFWVKPFFDIHLPTFHLQFLYEKCIPLSLQIVNTLNSLLLLVNKCDHGSQ